MTAHNCTLHYFLQHSNNNQYCQCRPFGFKLIYNKYLDRWMSTKEKENKNTRITVVLIDLNDEAYESNISCDAQLNVISSLASKMSGGLYQKSKTQYPLK